jgi:hypothetical protein
MSKTIQNYKFYCTVGNFSSIDKELIFGDFRIIKIKQGPEAAEWRRKLHCKEVPGYILEKNFLNYAVTDEDISGVDNIMHSMRDLLTCFRLFDVGDGKGGDIGFGNFLFEDIDDGQNSLIGLSNPINVSPRYKYPFGKEKIEKFNEFRAKTIDRCGYKNSFFQFALSYFMKGIDRGYFYNKRIGSERIIDYSIALESLFLIDGEKYFLRRTLAKRVSNFLSDASLEKKIKALYDERSKIVHGGYGEESDKKDIKKTDREEFEQIMRRIFVKLLDYNFLTKGDMVKFMKALFDIPKEALNLMRTAHNKAEEFLVN